jgi:hypothetical protein
MKMDRETIKVIIIWSLVVILLLLFPSCQKEDIKPYTEVPEEIVDTTAWNSGYNNGGTLPNGGGTTFQNNLIGTEWVITKVVTSFSTQYPNDTIRFVSNNKYTINNGAQKTYQLSLITNSNNISLRLDYVFTIGSGIYTGVLSHTFVEDGVVNDGQFTNYENSSDVRLVTMHKL